MGAPVHRPGAGDAAVVRCRCQLDDVVAFEQGHVRDGADATSDVALQERPARLVGGEQLDGTGADHPVPTQVVVQPRHIPTVEVGCATADKLVEESGEQLVQRLRAAGQQGMELTALGYTPSVSRLVGQRVALHHRHGLEEVRQRPRREQSGHACAQHHRMPTDRDHCAPIFVEASTKI